ncbi:MAG: SGNH/GDSL hydrolase family protein [Pirellulales bacterium]|nr:SGNH/GDSL hydrolase family protein [Pirellulales bacterium]
MRSFILRVARGVRAGWLMLGLSLALLIVLELVTRVVLASRAEKAESFSQAESYGGAPWAEEYVRELEQVVVTRWWPEAYWNSRPFAGRHFHIDDRGVRASWNPPDAQAETANPPRKVRVFMFGGSTTWGEGARDDYTIPSCLARSLAASGVEDFTVENFGVPGYVSAQEVIRLTQELRSGNVPDVVVFYDGANDVVSACLNGRAGVSMIEKPLADGSWNGLRNSLAVVRVVRFLAHRAEWIDSATVDGELAAGVVSQYQANIDLVRRLSETYGFTALFFWQPVLFSKPHLTTAEEQRQLFEDALSYGGTEEVFFTGYAVRDFFRDVYRRALAEVRVPGWHDLSGLFDEERGAAFIDYCHTFEAANAKIGQRLAQDVAPLVRARQQPRAEQQSAP